MKNSKSAAQNAVKQKTAGTRSIERPRKKEPEVVNNYTKVGHSPVKNVNHISRQNSRNSYHDDGIDTRGEPVMLDLNQNRRDRYNSDCGVDDEQQSAMLNDYYSTLTAQQQKLLQEKTPAFVRSRPDESPRDNFSSNRQLFTRGEDASNFNNQQPNDIYRTTTQEDEDISDNQNRYHLTQTGYDKTDYSPRSTNGGRPLQTEEIRQSIQQKQLELITQIREQAANESTINQAGGPPQSTNNGNNLLADITQQSNFDMLGLNGNEKLTNMLLQQQLQNQNNQLLQQLQTQSLDVPLTQAFLMQQQSQILDPAAALQQSVLNQSFNNLNLNNLLASNADLTASYAALPQMLGQQPSTPTIQNPMHQSQANLIAGGNTQSVSELNYAIVQYETVLQKLNNEFHLLLRKCQKLEQQVLHKETTVQQTNQKLLESEEHCLKLSHQNVQCKMQLGDLASEVEFLKSLKQASDEAGINSDGNEAFNFERETLIARISSLQNQMRMQQENEVELREQNDALMARVRKAETLQSNKENEMFHQMREMQAKDMELKNAGIFEFNLKQEIEQLQQQRMDLEDQLQDHQQSSCQMQIQQRQKEMETEGLRRESQGLKEQLQMVQQSHDELIEEISMLKEEANDLQMQKIKLQSTTERQDRELSTLRQKVHMQQEQINSNRDHMTSSQQSGRGGDNSGREQNRIDAYMRRAKEVAFAERDDYGDEYGDRENEADQGVEWPTANHKQQNHVHYEEEAEEIGWPSQNADHRRSHHQENHYEDTQDENQVLWASSTNTQQKQQRSKSARHFSSQQEDIAWGSQQNHVGDENYHSNIRPVSPPVRRAGVVPFASQRSQNNWVDPQQYDEMPAAGKASMVGALAQNLPGGSLAQMQNTLSALMIQKQNLENESRKVASKVRSKVQLEQKQELEQQLEMVDRDVHALKQQLRQVQKA